MIAGLVSLFPMEELSVIVSLKYSLIRLNVGFLRQKQIF